MELGKMPGAVTAEPRVCAYCLKDLVQGEQESDKKFAERITGIRPTGKAIPWGRAGGGGLTAYDKHLKNRTEYLNSELGQQRDKYLRSHGWKRLFPSPIGKKPIDPTLCVSYKQKDSVAREQPTKLQIFSDGKIRISRGGETTETFSGWEDFLLKEKGNR